MATAGTVLSVRDIGGDAGIGLLHNDSNIMYVSLPIPAESIGFGERITLIHAVHQQIGTLHLTTLNHSRVERWEHRTSRYVAGFYGVNCPDKTTEIGRRMYALACRMQDGERMRLMGANSGLRLAASG
jgi:hypothetical protein